jgi:hypothetical protein
MCKRFLLCVFIVGFYNLFNGDKLLANAYINYAVVPDTITLYGTSFIPTSQAKLNGGMVQTIYISPTILKAIVPSGTPIGRYPVTVFNPTQGGGTSGAQDLNIIAINDSSIALQYIYQTRQTMFTLIDSSRTLTVSPGDSALWWSQVAPVTSQNAVDMRISVGGNYVMTINDLNAEVSETPQVKKMIFRSEDSILVCYDRYNTQVSSLKMTNFGVFDMKPLVDSLRNANGTTILNGIVPGATGGITMTQYASNEAGSGAVVTDLDAIHKQIVRNSPTSIGGIPFPPNASIISVVNTQSNVLETLTIRDNTTLLPLCRTTIVYSNVGGTSVLKAAVNELFDTMPGGTPIKIINVTEYQQMTYNNYLR